MANPKKILTAVEKASENVSKWSESKRAAFEETSGLKLSKAQPGKSANPTDADKKVEKPAAK